MAFSAFKGICSEVTKFNRAFHPMRNTNAMAGVLQASGPSWELPYIFLEEQVAAKLERFLNREGIFTGRISARLIPYLRAEEALQAFLICLSQNKIRKKVYHIRECVAVNWKGETYWLTTEGLAIIDEPLLWPAMDQFIMRKRDVYDPGKPLPISLVPESSPPFQGGGEGLDMEEIKKQLVGLGAQKDDALEQLLIIGKLLITGNMRR